MAAGVLRCPTGARTRLWRKKGRVMGDTNMAGSGSSLQYERDGRARARHGPARYQQCEERPAAEMWPPHLETLSRFQGMLDALCGLVCGLEHEPCS